MYSQNFGMMLTTKGNFCAGTVERPTEIEYRGLPTYESSAGEFQFVSEPRRIPAATPTKTVGAEPSAHHAVAGQPTPTPNVASETARIEVLKKTSMTAAVFCVVTAVGISIFAPTAMEARLLGSALWLGIALGIYLMSRFATVIGLVLIAINFVVTVMLIFTFPHPEELNFKVVNLVGLFYVWWTKATYEAMIGSFEYHRSLSSR